MNPYATAFSHLMNQYSSAPSSNGQGTAQAQALQGTAPMVNGQIVHPAYQVYIPGAAQPHQYPHQQAYPYSYPTYPTYPMAMQSQYAVSANMPMAYGAPMMYPQAMPQGHMPPGQPPQQQHAQQPHNNRPGNKNKPGYQNNKRPQPLQNSASVPNPSPVFPVTPAATISQPQTAAVLSPAAHPPISTTHFCEACDKEFPNQSTYNSHCSTHEQCSYPGCSFTASKRVVQAHFHSTHGLYSGQGFKDIEVEGQSFRVLLGTSPEEVAQWRAERRKKFPSGAAGGGGGGGAETTSSSGGQAPRTTNPSTTGNQPPTKSQAALRREEWKQKKKQQQLERQHYKELRKAHHSRPTEAEDGSPAGNATAAGAAGAGGGAAEHRNFIQIHSSAGPTKGVEVISSTGTDEDPANVTSIRLSNSATDGTTQPPPAKRARFEKQPPKQRHQHQPPQQQQPPKRERGGSVLRKPDISGNLLTKLLQKEIYAEECLILATIRYLRQLYDPDYPQQQQPTTTTVSAGPVTTAAPTTSLIEEVAATATTTATSSSSSGLAAVASPALAELLTKDIDDLLAEVEAAEANGDDDDEDDEERIGEREDGEEDDDDIDEEDDDHISDGDDNGDGDGDDEGLMGGIVRTGGNRSVAVTHPGGSRRKDEPQRLEAMDVEEDGRHPLATSHHLPVPTHHHRVAVSHLPGMDEYASDNDNDNDNEEQEDGEIREG